MSPCCFPKGKGEYASTFRFEAILGMEVVTMCSHLFQLGGGEIEMFQAST
jgi:hypothetical protein